MVSKEFEDAKSRLSTLTEDPGNETKLKIYGLFKQVVTKLYQNQLSSNVISRCLNR